MGIICRLSGDHLGIMGTIRRQLGTVIWVHLGDHLPIIRGPFGDRRGSGKRSANRKERALTSERATASERALPVGPGGRSPPDDLISLLGVSRWSHKVLVKTVLKRINS